jgi:hypothetical protein
MLDHIARGPFGSAWRHPLVATIILGLIMIFFYVINIPICGTVFLVYALICATIWVVRLARDQQAVTQARERAQQAPPPPAVMQLPPQTSRGSGRMFVPPPIDQDR